MRFRSNTVLMLFAALIMASLIVEHARAAESQDLKQLQEKRRALTEERRKFLLGNIERFKERITPLMEYSIVELQYALTLKVREKYEGAKIYSTEEKPTYLGTIADDTETDSIFNTFGSFGSSFSSSSIWNEFGRYGGQFSQHSPFNQFTSSPPFIMKNDRIIGRLTVNSFVRDALDPNWLRSFFKF